MNHEIRWNQKYLNNIVEQDHRAVKRVTRPMLGFKSFHAARRTLVGIELMHMIKKKQLVTGAAAEGRTAAELFLILSDFGVERSFLKTMGCFQVLCHIGRS